MKTFSELERQCQLSFSMCGEVCHAYTSGKEMPILFVTVEDLAFAMNVTAYAAFKFKDAVSIIAFEVMNNHFHFVITGGRNNINEFFATVVKKLKHTIPLAGKLDLCLKPITDLNAMRHNIIYTNRNGYVANPHYTPFSYPWGTGGYYFDGKPSATTFADISYTRNRMIFRGGNVNLPPDWIMNSAYDGSNPYIYVAPPSFCNIKLGMAMFRDAHHYFSMVSKNVEAFSGIAVDIDDGEFLTDSEVFSETLKILHAKYNGARLTGLSPAQKLDLARALHFDYRSSNGQIRRVLGLCQYEVDQLFPK